MKSLTLSKIHVTVGEEVSALHLFQYMCMCMCMISSAQVFSLMLADNTLAQVEAGRSCAPGVKSSNYRHRRNDNGVS